MTARTEAAAIVAGCTAAGALWTAFASSVFLLGTGLVRHYPLPVWQWWIYLPYYADNMVVRRWLLISAGAATLVLVGIVLAWLTSKPRAPKLRPRLDGKARGVIRGATDNFGHAEWMTLQELEQLFPGPHPKHGGVVVGEAYRVDQDRVAALRFRPGDRSTWGMGGRTPLLVDPCTEGSSHSLVIAGAGGFKSTSAVSTLLHWTGSAVVLDPSGELGPMLTEARADMGHTVAVLDPAQVDRCAFNVLDWIDVEAAEAEANVMAVCSWICGESGGSNNSTAEDEFFRNQGRNMVACLLAHLLWDDTLPASAKTLRTLRVAVVAPVPIMRAVLRSIHANSNSRLARHFAGSLMDFVDETFSGIYGNANESTAWLSIGTYADLVSGDSFRAADVAGGQLSVFVQIPLKTMQATPALGRVIIGALLNAVYEADGRVEGRVLFLLDEVARLGPMGILETARDAGRKYGITLQLLYQSVGQINAQWGQDGRRAWYDSVSWRAYAAVQDMDTAKEVSAAAGEHGVMMLSEGDNRGTSGRTLEALSRSRGSNTTLSEARRLLIKPEELTHDARTDELFVFARGARPIRCGRAIYFRRPELARRVAGSRFVVAAE